MSSRSPSPRQHSSYPSYPDRRNARKSISLSPIRTESGANLRTANWTKMRFRAPGDNRGGYHQNNWNNRGNYHNNYNRGGYGNPRGRWVNRGNYRGNNNYRGGWNNRGGGGGDRYIPKKRHYSRGSRSRSRSRSRSYSRSRSRSYSGERRYSYSRSRSRSKRRSSTSRSPSPIKTKKISAEIPQKQPENVVAKSEAVSYFKDTKESPKKSETGKIFGKWDSPQRKFEEKPKTAFGNYKMKNQEAIEKNSFKPSMAFKSFPEINPKELEEPAGGKPAVEVQQMMEKTALASVARHEKSLLKIKKAQGKIKKQVKSDSSEEDNAAEEEQMMILMAKSAKKAKKKKNKSKMAKKLARQKMKKQMKMTTSSSDSDEKSSDNSSDSSVEAIKKKSSRKKKHMKTKQGSMSPQSKKIRSGVDPMSVGSAYPANGNQATRDGNQLAAPYLQQLQQPMVQAPNQPMMLMAPGFMGPNGQPMGMIQLAVPGPDGQLQVIQIPQMATRDGQQAPFVMLPQGMQAQPTVVQPQQGNLSYPSVPASTQPQAQPQPVPVPKPVPPPASESPAPAPTGIMEVQMEEEEIKEEEIEEVTQQELSEKQKRRKEVIRTRMWPRPASSNWGEDDGDEQNDEHEKEAEDEKRETDSWTKPSKSESGIPGFDYTSKSNEKQQQQDDVEERTKSDFSPNQGNLSQQQNQGDNSNAGQKIPTLTRINPIHETTMKETIDELPRKKQENIQQPIQSSQSSSEVSKSSFQPQLVAYPTHITQHAYEPVYVGAQASKSVAPVANIQSDISRSKEKQWNAAAEDFLHRSERQSAPKSKFAEPESSSDDDFTKAIRAKYQSAEYRKSNKKKSYQEEGQVEVMEDDEGASADEQGKKKKRKKNKKERKDSIGTEEPTSPLMKEKKRKKKKKNKDKDVSIGSDQEMRRSKKKRNIDESHMEEDELVRNIPHDLPLSHIRGLVVRQDSEGDDSIFHHVDFDKLSLQKGYIAIGEKDSYEDQFVSLFGGSEEPQKPSKSSVLGMSKKSLRKVKVTPQGPRSVSHMTEISLSERIASIYESRRSEEKHEKNKSSRQKVSVNLASVSKMEDKFEKGRSRSRSRSSTPQRRHHSSRGRRSSSNDSGSSRSRSRSRSRSHSRSRSLPKAYSADGRFGRQCEYYSDQEDSRDRTSSREDDRRDYRSGGYNRGQFQPYNNRYNQRYNNYRGRGNFQNFRPRGGRFFHSPNYRGRGGYNPNYRGRGGYNNNNNYYNNNYYNNNREQGQWRNRRPSYRSDEEERRERRRSRSYSSGKQSYSSRSSDGEVKEKRSKPEPTVSSEAHYSKGKAPVDPGPVQSFEAAPDQDPQGAPGNPKVRRKSPDQWAHDMFEEHEKAEE